MGIGILMMLIMLVGSFAIYDTTRDSLYGQLDDTLKTSLALQATEVEIVGNVLLNDWLEDLKNDPFRSRREYVSVWDLSTGEIVKSPALGRLDLPKLPGDPANIMIETVRLTDGTKLRAAGIQLLPTLDGEGEVDRVKLLVPEDHPQLMVFALETKAVDQALNRLLVVLAIVLLASVLISFLAGNFLIETSLKPIANLEERLEKIEADDAHGLFEMPKTFPLELTGLAEKYRDLLLRISKVRLRERDFSANAAHELRTPLAGILATLEQTLLMDRSPEEYRKRLNAALGITEGMRTLVDRLMWLSKLQNRTVKILSAEVNVNALIEERFAILEPKIESRNLIVQRISEGEDLTVISDHSLLSIIIANLLQNAVSHSEEGTIIRIEVSSKRGGKVVISNEVKDRKLPDMERIFEPFYTEDEAHSDAGHSGIGLALCKAVEAVLDLRLEVHGEHDGLFVSSIYFPEV